MGTKIRKSLRRRLATTLMAIVSVTAGGIGVARGGDEVGSIAPVAVVDLDGVLGRMSGRFVSPLDLAAWRAPLMPMAADSMAADSMAADSANVAASGEVAGLEDDSEADELRRCEELAAQSNRDAAARKTSMQLFEFWRLRDSFHVRSNDPVQRALAGLAEQEPIDVSSEQTTEASVEVRDLASRLFEEEEVTIGGESGAGASGSDVAGGSEPDSSHWVALDEWMAAMAERAQPERDEANLPPQYAALAGIGGGPMIVTLDEPYMAYDMSPEDLIALRMYPIPGDEPGSRFPGIESGYAKASDIAAAMPAEAGASAGAAADEVLDVDAVLDRMIAGDVGSTGSVASPSSLMAEATLMEPRPAQGDATPRAESPRVPPLALAYQTAIEIVEAQERLAAADAQVKGEEVPAEQVVVQAEALAKAFDQVATTLERLAVGLRNAGDQLVRQARSGGGKAGASVIR
jgi:hypothetical protein